MIGNGKIFVSHTHADNARCEPLLTALDAWRQDYWFDGEQLDAGQQLTPRLQEAILQRDVLLRVCTVNSANSYWMNLERSAFRAAQYQQGKNSPRVCLDLIFDTGYTPGALERADATVVAVNKPQHVWLAELAAALDVKQRVARRGDVSRRAVLGLGGAAAITAASLAAGGVIAKTRLDAAAAPYPKPQAIAFTNPQTMDPRIKWYFKAGDSTGAAMALTGSLLIVATYDGVFALDTQSGAIRWARTDAQGDESTSVQVVGDTIYLSQLGLAGSLTALKVESGATIWNAQTTSGFGDGLFARVGDVVYMVSDDTTLASYSLRDGSSRWRSSVKIVANTTFNRAPAADANGVYIGDDNGLFSAFSPVDGSRLWTYQVTSGNGAINSTAALANGVVFFATQSQQVFALDTFSGALRWRYDAAASVNYTPAVSGDTLYLGLYDHVAALNAGTGELRWSAALDASNTAVVTGPITVSGSDLYIPAASYLYAFGAAQQQKLWRFQSRQSDENNLAPVVAGTMVYWSAANGAIYALDATAGN